MGEGFKGQFRTTVKPAEFILLGGGLLLRRSEIESIEWEGVRGQAEESEILVAHIRMKSGKFQVLTREPAVELRRYFFQEDELTDNLDGDFPAQDEWVTRFEGDDDE